MTVEDPSMEDDVWGAALMSYVAAYMRDSAVEERIVFGESLEDAREQAEDASGPEEVLIEVRPNMDVDA